MSNHDIRQQAKCHRLKKVLLDRAIERDNWIRQAEQLEQDLRTQERLLSDLHRQVARTKDSVGFAPQIRNIETKIEKLRRLIAKARVNADHWARAVREAEQALIANDCTMTA